MSRLFLVALAAIIVLGSILLYFAYAPIACAHANSTAPTYSQEQIAQVLNKFKSPLPSATIYYFSLSHPDFDIAGYLAVMWAESSLGKACDYKHNPGSIKGGSRGTVWRDLRIGISRAGYNVYPDLYTGQRAAIRLIYDSATPSYNHLLATHNWTAFANRYYGRSVPGLQSYIRTLRAAHAQLIKAGLK